MRRTDHWIYHLKKQVEEGILLNIRFWMSMRLWFPLTFFRLKLRVSLICGSERSTRCGCGCPAIITEHGRGLFHIGSGNIGRTGRRNTRTGGAGMLGRIRGGQRRVALIASAKNWLQINHQAMVGVHKDRPLITSGTAGMSEAIQVHPKPNIIIFSIRMFDSESWFLKLFFLKKCLTLTSNIHLQLHL